MWRLISKLCNEKNNWDTYFYKLCNEKLRYLFLYEGNGIIPIVLLLIINAAIVTTLYMTVNIITTSSAAETTPKGPSTSTGNVHERSRRYSDFFFLNFDQYLVSCNVDAISFLKNKEVLPHTTVTLEIQLASQGI